MTNDRVFDWRLINTFSTRKTYEVHYKCINTGAYKCIEYKGDAYLGSLRFKGESFSLPNSDDYNIDTEDKLLNQLTNK